MSSISKATKSYVRIRMSIDLVKRKDYGLLAQREQSCELGRYMGVQTELRSSLRLLWDCKRPLSFLATCAYLAVEHAAYCTWLLCPHSIVMMDTLQRSRSLTLVPGEIRSGRTRGSYCSCCLLTGATFVIRTAKLPSGRGTTIPNFLFSSNGDLFHSRSLLLRVQKTTDIRMIQDYFGKTIGPTKKVLLTYGPTGKSRGVATIIFADPAAGAKAASQLDGVKVDQRAMRVSPLKESMYAE